MTTGSTRELYDPPKLRLGGPPPVDFLELEEVEFAVGEWGFRE
jgi:hypothetical protein